MKKNSEGSLINIKTTHDEGDAIYISTGWFKNYKRKKSKYKDDSEDDNYNFSQTQQIFTKT